jgi:predicted glycosyltransferase involved in capsule biosynthesis
MIDLSNVTFIIPIRIDSDDRLRNTILVTNYLTKTFDCKIIIKESDIQNRFEAFLPKSSNITYIFEQTDNPSFHRTRLLNDMLLMSDTDIVVNYDCDVILPTDSYIKASKLILEDSCDLVYPFRFGYRGAMMINLSSSMEDDFVKEFLDMPEPLNLESRGFYRWFQDEGWAEYGFCQFFKRTSYIDGFMENENFIAYGPEDVERHHRWDILGYKIGRVDNLVYHIEHARSENSWSTNPYIGHNQSLWNYIQTLNKEQLIDYYQKQNYINERKNGTS